jgi:hypothetical protein
MILEDSFLLLASGGLLLLIQYEAGSDGEPTGIHGSTGAWPPSDEPVEYWEWEEFRRLEHLSGCVSPVLVRDEAAAE